MQSRNSRIPVAIRLIFIVASVVLLLSIFLKAIIHVDTNYDTGWYHHVFAARIWGIIPKESFATEKLIEYRYDGFPLLAHFLQGLFWKITGSIKATNLVAYFSLIIYIFFLRSCFQISWYISTIAILTIPAVLTHSTASYVDLLASIGVSVALMMIYKFWITNTFPSKKDLLILGLGMFVAANTKPQSTVFIGLLWIAAVYVLIKIDRKKLLLFAVPVVLISLLIFYTSIKNLALYGNPLYPIKSPIPGIVLNHEATPATYSQGNRPQKWLRSILEIRTFKWSVDQHDMHDKRPNILDRAGGFFGAYVVFNLLLLINLVVLEYRRKKNIFNREKNKSISALVIVIILSVVVANFPQSHELRYSMFWMISLVSLNLSIVYSSNIQLFSKSLITYYSLALLAFFVAMCIEIDNYYLGPFGEKQSLPPRGFTSAQEYIEDENAVKSELVEQIKRMSSDEKNICLLSRPAIPKPTAVPYASIANAIFYSSYFYKDIDNDYSIQTVTSPEGCGNLPMIPSPPEKDK